MKNRNIVHAHQEVEIYREHYRPSFNMWRFTRSILGVLLFGSSTVARSHVQTNKKMLIK